MIRSFVDFLPAPLRAVREFRDVFDFLREKYEMLANAIDGLQLAHAPDRTPFPAQYGRHVAAYFSDDASIREVRQAAYEAPKLHRRPLSFELSWKDPIDRITGGDSRIYQGNQLESEFIIGSSMIGGKDSLGDVVFGRAESLRLTPRPRGFVQIDLNMATDPTDAELDAVVAKLAPLRGARKSFFIGVVRASQDLALILGDDESIIGENYLIGGTPVAFEFFEPMRIVQ